MKEEKPQSLPIFFSFPFFSFLRTRGGTWQIPGETFRVVLGALQQSSCPFISFKEGFLPMGIKA